MSKNIMTSIPRAETPEEVGVSSKAVASFLDDIEKSDMAFHSFMIIRHGKVAAECFRAPFTADRPHAMYSVSKTFTSTAIGFAVSEGLIALSDLVKDYFPDYTDNMHDEKLDKLTIEDLISMKAGKDPGLITDKSHENWIEAFFNCAWYNEPGVEYRYISENIYMLCAILTRVTGMTVREYLNDRLFKPLSIDYPFWETDQYGIEAGGWGLYLKTEDVAKVMLCYSQGGKWDGKQVIPEFWTKVATQIHSDNSANSALDAKAGYGYCIWRCGGANAYRADGMFSQFGIVFEDYDAVLVTTSGIPVEQKARDFIWKHFPGVFLDETKDNGETSYPCLKERLAGAVLESAPKISDSTLEKKIDGQVIHFRKHVLLDLIGFPMSVLPLAVTYMTTDKAGNIDNVIFNFTDSDCSMKWTEGDETNTILAGMDGRYRYGIMRLGQIDYKVCCSAQWTESDKLYIQIRPIETIGKRMLEFKFRANGRVIMKPSSSPSIAQIAEFLTDSMGDLVKVKVIRDIATFALKFLPPIVEPKHRGKIHYN